MMAFVPSVSKDKHPASYRWLGSTRASSGGPLALSVTRSYTRSKVPADFLWLRREAQKLAHSWDHIVSTRVVRMACRGGHRHTDFGTRCRPQCLNKGRATPGATATATPAFYRKQT